MLINKPEGWTSFDVVAFVRKLSSPPFQGGARPQRLSIAMAGAVGVVAEDGSRQLNRRQTPSSLPLGNGEMTTPAKRKRIKVGHAGTLDPFASGLLIVGVGREATKRLDEFKAMPKTYVATIKLGAISDTYDRTGNIKKIFNEYSTNITPTIKQIKKIIKSFVGKQLQTPPMFSAKKINGKKLYELARKGIEIERRPNEIEIYKIKILDYSWPLLKIEVRCSAGTYIRSLAHDIGQKLGVGAYCRDLTRTKIGRYHLNKAHDIKGLTF